MPDENPGAAVVTALNDENTRWAIVTNGKLWRLYSRNAHSRSTNFYEVDLEEALIASAETDPNEAFRYWWLFFRAEAFRPLGDDGRCWLDTIVQGSRDYAKRLGDRLKDRVFVEIFPHLADGFLADRKQRRGIKAEPTDSELSDAFQATLTLLYRLLFLLYAEARDLLPIRESPYQLASLKRIKDEIAENAGSAEGGVTERLAKAYDRKSTKLYDRLSCLFEAMDKGDTALNVPCYNGGLFITDPKKLDDRENRIARFLIEHKVPDLYLALAIDRLSRDQDEKPIPGAVSPDAKLPYGLVPIDYKSLEVRHLGSIYEGLLEFKLKIAEEDLTTTTEKKREKYIPLSQAKPGRGKRSAAVKVKKGEVYLSNDKAERKATGSYYTPDPIVEYIVEHTVGPVLQEKLDRLREEFRKAGKTFHKWMGNVRDDPELARQSDPRTFAGAKTYAAHKDLVDQLFDFKVLDPAMGSGHFLVEAVDFITDALLDFLNRFPNNPVVHALERTRSSILEALGQQGVTVDANKLTDVNLLKRHVLKRCIYGVDLNPMAVELAKVSLWLDAFTLGAPLSFLDHHLRCGNSLIGATFRDLEDAMIDKSAMHTMRMFGIDYSPMLDAIRSVLFVNAMADATADEVKESLRRYGDARKALSGYKIVFDLLVADYFLDLSTSQGGTKGGSSRKRGAKSAAGPKPSTMLTHASDLTLTSRDAFMQSLRDDADREMVTTVEELAEQPDRRFFHWEIEFPEVFFGFEDTDQRRIKHKDIIHAGSAGFDAIVGNPPYVRQESITPLKSYLQAHYATFDSTNDLYVYFQEREVIVLRTQGQMGMIVANKWMRAGYGRAVRRFLQRVAQPLQVIDFGHSPIFPDADTFPCIPIVARRAQSLLEGRQIPDDETMIVCSVPREHWNERMNLSDYVRPRRSSIPTCLLREEGWSLEDPHVQTLLEKIRNTGVRLSEYCGVNAMFGLKTGLNEAFYVDYPTRERLICEDGRSAEVIKPLLRGRDIDRWKPKEVRAWLITIPSSQNVKSAWSGMGNDAERRFAGVLPAIYRHLLPHKQALVDRQDQGDFWWELRSCDYYDAFFDHKIVLQRIGFHCQVAVDELGAFTNDSTTMLPCCDPYIHAILNSSLMWWYMWRTLAHMKDEALFVNTTQVDLLPIASAEEESKSKMGGLVDLLCRLKLDLQALEKHLLDSLSSRINIEGLDQRILTWITLPTNEFLRRLKGASLGHSQIVHEISSAHNTTREQYVGLLRRQFEVESTLATLVEDAYGLSLEERKLLRDTRPIRDPLDVLEAKITGGSPIDVESDETDEKAE